MGLSPSGSPFLLGEKMDLTHFSLFSGIGGFDLAAEWAGFRTIGLVEKNPYRQKVLRKYWPSVPLWEDIRDVTKESLKEANLRTVTLVTGGFPCQSFSIAGKRRGKADDRYLWPEMFRVIRLLRPHWVLAENVTGIIRMALNDVLSDLESEGYRAIPFIIPACGVNAPHRRYRVWIVAHYEGSRLRPQFNKLTNKLLSENRPSQKFEGSNRYVSDPEGIGTQGNRAAGQQEPGTPVEEGLSGCHCSRDGATQWESEPGVGRVANGVPHRVDRLAALGDAIVPQVAYQILKAIAEIEKTLYV